MKLLNEYVIFYRVATMAGKAGKAGKRVFLKNWAGKAGRRTAFLVVLG